ncbi:MAG: O-antigen ligase family protein [Actinomycetota bacterium]|nr:O-antigen ligase family protein [Actinomycetota bacterium]
MTEFIAAKKNQVFLLPPLVLLILLIGVTVGFLASRATVVVIILVFGVASLMLVSKNHEWGLLLMAFFLPFQRLLTLEVAGYTLQVAQAMVIITFLIWFLNMLEREEVKLVKTPLNVPLLIFLLANLVSIWNAINVTRAIAIFMWATFSVMVYFLLVNTVRNEEILKKVIKVLIISGVSTSIFGIYQFIGSYLGLPTFLRDVYGPTGWYLTRIHSTALEPLHFASYLLVVIPVTAALYQSRSAIFSRSLLFFGLVIMGIAMLMTIARGGYVGLVLAVFVIFLLSKRNAQTRGGGKKILVALICGAVILAIVVALLAPGMLRETIVGGTAVRAGSSFTRMLLIKDAWGMLESHPLLGIGVGNFGPYYNRFYKIPSTAVADFRTVNNVPMEILTETGIFGFLALAWVLLRYVRSMWGAIKRTPDPFIYALLVGFMASFFGLAFQYLTYSPFYAIWTWFMLGMSMVTAQLAKMKGD